MQGAIIKVSALYQRDPTNYWETEVKTITDCYEPLFICYIGQAVTCQIPLRQGKVSMLDNQSDIVAVPNGIKKLVKGCGSFGIDHGYLLLLSNRAVDKLTAVGFFGVSIPFVSVTILNQVNGRNAE